ncbi:MAG: Fe(2+) transporter FeoB [Firmicutes bacterium]|nr:Fe(2+) transporter FeoB [Bacillota bacterium]
MYSLFADSAEEEIARNFLAQATPDCTIVVVDATCTERNLYLALQVLALTRRVVVCVNLVDEAKRKGIPSM